MTRFKELRQQRGLTQEEFRRQFNARFNRSYTVAAISQFENGKRIPETFALIDFADFYGVSVDYLLGHKEPEKSLDLSDDEKTLLFEYRTMDDEGKAAVRWIIKQHKPLPSARSPYSPIIARRKFRM